MSRLLFDRAAKWWQVSLLFECFAAGLGVLLSLVSLSLNESLLAAIAVVSTLLLAYVFRYRSNGTYDSAETMRRQSVLSEGLGWELGRAELMQWQSLAGAKIIAKAQLNPRPDDYYDNSLGGGYKKLAEMTFESLHWTRCLYSYLRSYCLIALLIATLAIATPIIISLFDFLPADARTALAYSAFVFAPAVLTLDLIGLVLKLSRSIDELNKLSVLLERPAKLQSPKPGEVMRLVAEYNCVVASGTPIPNWVWRVHASEIAQSWKSSR